jgi:hypothetical protein
MSKTLIYHGEYAEVEIRPPYGWAVFPRGEPVEVDDELAARLLGEYPGTFSTGEHPQVSAPKDVWETFRAGQGHDVDGLTKQELIDLPDTPADVKD